MRLAFRCVVAAWMCMASSATFGDAPGTSVKISGNVQTASLQPLGGVVITLTNGQTYTTDGSGNYSASVPTGFSGTATPSLTGYSFSPPSRSYNNVTLSQSGENYAATPVGSL